jgi:hypothetical protein
LREQKLFLIRIEMQMIFMQILNAKSQALKFQSRSEMCVAINLLLLVAADVSRLAAARAYAQGLARWRNHSKAERKTR